ncbi:Hypothetical protein SMB2099_1898 [Serratia marcescens SMB2099]|nr:Hypothetical protein SMB2099_1898 [Serratia marcescens SMB2099]
MVAKNRRTIYLIFSIYLRKCENKRSEQTSRQAHRRGMS